MKAFIKKKKKKSGYVKIADKVDFRAKKITRDQKRHYVMTKRPTHQEDIIILNVYVPHNRVSKYMKQNPIELKEKWTIIVGDFNTSLSN